MPDDKPTERPTKLAELRSRMNELEGEILELTEKEILEDHEEERYTELTAEWDALKPELDKLEDRAKMVEGIQRRARDEFRGVPERTTRALDELATRDIRTMGNKEARDGALRILEDRDQSFPLTSYQGTVVDKAVRRDPDIARRVIVTENDAYRSAFMKLMSNPNAAAYLNDEERFAVARVQEYRAQSEGTDTAGGFAIPVFIDPSVILTDQESDNPFLSIARTVNITTNAWKGVSAAGVQWSFDDEGDEVSDDSITIAQPTVDVFTARGFIPFSIEIEQDWPGFQAEMGHLLAVGYDDLLLSAFTNGNGTSAPRGIITALDANTNVEVVSTTDGAFGDADLYKVWKALPQKYRRRASWLMSVGVMNKIRQFGTANNFHATTVQLGAGQVETLFNRQVYEDDYFPDFTGTTGAENRLVVGDFSNFVIARRSGMSVELVPHLVDVGGSGFPTGQRGWFAWARIGSNSVNDLGFRLLQNQ